MKILKILLFGVLLLFSLVSLKAHDDSLLVIKKYIKLLKTTEQSMSEQLLVKIHEKSI